MNRSASAIPDISLGGSTNGAKEETATPKSALMTTPIDGLPSKADALLLFAARQQA
jgi:hypothetical protein